MANAVRVRVEARNHGGSHDDRDIEFRKMMTKFRKQVMESGVLNTYKQHQTFESKSRKKRRKGREAEVARLKQMLRDNFAEKKQVSK
jgi:ribosomal protein S21